MSSGSTLRALAIASLLVASACGGKVAPIENIQNQPIAAGSTKLPLDEITRRIKVASLQHNWVVNQDGPGKLSATHNYKGHTATVEINYNQEHYDIIYVSSENLRADNNEISRHYGEWVRGLKLAIDRELTIAGQ
jgi:hypothetical protein